MHRHENEMGPEEQVTEGFEETVDNTLRSLKVKLCVWIHPILDSILIEA
jgi:hypothetical protein